MTRSFRWTRVFEHPLGVVAFGHGEIGAEKGGVKGDRAIQVFDLDMDVEALHADFLCDALEVAAGAQHASGAQAAPAQHRREIGTDSRSRMARIG